MIYEPNEGIAKRPKKVLYQRRPIATTTSKFNSIRVVNETCNDVSNCR